MVLLFSFDGNSLGIVNLFTHEPSNKMEEKLKQPTEENFPSLETLFQVFKKSWITKFIEINI